jgi:hypothetical protein
MDATKAELELEIATARRRLDNDVAQIFRRVDEARDRFHDLRLATRNVALALGAAAVGVALVVTVTRLIRRPHRR